MGSISSNKPRTFTAHHNAPPCTRTHQIGALLLVTATFFLTRLFDNSFSPCTPRYHDRTSQSQNVDHIADGGGGSFTWPQRGYGSYLSLKIYVYEENEIDGLQQLLRGRKGKISADACIKGQWGTQVIWI